MHLVFTSLARLRHYAAARSVRRCSTHLSLVDQGHLMVAALAGSGAPLATIRALLLLFVADPLVPAERRQLYRWYAERIRIASRV